MSEQRSVEINWLAVADYSRAYNEQRAEQEAKLAERRASGTGDSNPGNREKVETDLDTGLLAATRTADPS